MNNLSFSSQFSARYASSSSYALTSSYSMNGGGGGGINGIGVSIDGGGDLISPGVHGIIQIPQNLTFGSWRMMADQIGTVKIEIWKSTFDNYPPTAVGSITGTGNEPAIINAIKAEDTDLSNWVSASLMEDDILFFNVPEASENITKVTLQLFIQ